ncbi:MAG: polynucleotide adenylyltransferase PcnB [Geobacter sp.]|nr:polynucleotide adenylyltransferase PcnB [Geobacter sp.]
MQTKTTQIIRRSSHNISRKELSPNAVRIMYRLRDNGFIARLVGGAVRDILIGKTPKDFDIVTDATPEQIRRLFRNCRLVGRRFRLAHLHFKEEIIEVSTFRASSSPEEIEDPDAEAGSDDAAEETGRSRHLLVNDDGMLLRDNLFGTPEEDAWRRDFTINALSYDIADFSIIDYIGGIEDIDKRIIRTIGDPNVRFTEDPVRMLRAVRLAAQLGFTIEKHSWQAMVDMAGRISQAAPARLFDELLKLFLSGAAVHCYNLLRKSQLLASLLPEFSAYLQESNDGRVVAALHWLDNRVSSGRGTSPQLVLAAIFGSYLTSGAAGHPYQERLDSSLAAFMTELNGRIHIPQRVLMKLREILLLESRLVNVPGRKPQNVVARHGFAEAMEYLQLQAEHDHDLLKSVRWWERYAGDNPPPAEQSSDGDSAEPRRKRRPRRRKPKKQLH